MFPSKRWSKKHVEIGVCFGSMFRSAAHLMKGTLCWYVSGNVSRYVWRYVSEYVSGYVSGYVSEGSNTRPS